MQGWMKDGARVSKNYPYGKIAFAGTGRAGVYYRWGTRWSLGFSGVVNQMVTTDRFSRKNADRQLFGAQEWQMCLSLGCRF